jgi:hypothetical protein
MTRVGSLVCVCMGLLLGGTPGATQARPEATSLSGRPLFRITLPDQQKLEANLAQAEADLAARPTDPEAIIWVGRRLGYLWRYQDAIVMFSKGVALHPNNPKMYRHRGHRYITVRQFDRAVEDLQKAAGMIAGTPTKSSPMGSRTPRASRAARCTSISGITSAWPITSTAVSKTRSVPTNSA